MRRGHVNCLPPEQIALMVNGLTGERRQTPIRRRQRLRRQMRSAATIPDISAPSAQALTTSTRLMWGGQRTCNSDERATLAAANRRSWSSRSRAAPGPSVRPAAASDSLRSSWERRVYAPTESSTKFSYRCQHAITQPQLARTITKPQEQDSIDGLTSCTQCAVPVRRRSGTDPCTTALRYSIVPLNRC